ncbi:MAG: hypothetical protein LJE70_20855, partial [Chromatiaceae bacterium]|nr:hypothetical protein [Chromatiaceae bacterium]
MKNALHRAITVLLATGFGLAGADVAANTLLGPGDLVITGVNAVGILYCADTLQMIDEYRAAGVHPRDVWAQSLT